LGSLGRSPEKCITSAIRVPAETAEKPPPGGDFRVSLLHYYS
jgi:hypothetical protein